jgi:hypothetical protein
VRRESHWTRASGLDRAPRTGLWPVPVPVARRHRPPPESGAGARRPIAHRPNAQEGPLRPARGPARAAEPNAKPRESSTPVAVVRIQNCPPMAAGASGIEQPADCRLPRLGGSNEQKSAFRVAAKPAPPNRRCARASTWRLAAGTCQQSAGRRAVQGLAVFHRLLLAVVVMSSEERLPRTLLYPASQAST